MTPNADRLRNLTKEQQDLLRLIVSKYREGYTGEFRFVKNVVSSSLGWGHVTERIEADKTDFHRLSREGLIDFRIDQRIIWGKPTAAGITAIVDADDKASCVTDAVENPTPPVQEAVFRKNGRVWTVSFEGKTSHFPDKVGLRHIAELLRRPGVPIEAVVLAGTKEQVAPIPIAPGLPIADSQTISAVEKELATKRVQLAGVAESAWYLHGELTNEISKLEDYLAKARDQHANVRIVAGTAQRSRTSVTNAINRAIADIAEQHASLGSHLKQSIKKGTAPVYEPVETPDWQF